MPISLDKDKKVTTLDKASRVILTYDDYCNIETVFKLLLDKEFLKAEELDTLDAVKRILTLMEDKKRNKENAISRSTN